MDKEVKLNLTVNESLRKDLKDIAKSKGLKFHPWVARELEKIVNRHNGAKK